MTVDNVIKKRAMKAMSRRPCRAFFALRDIVTGGGGDIDDKGTIAFFFMSLTEKRREDFAEETGLRRLLVMPVLLSDCMTGDR